MSFTADLNRYATKTKSSMGEAKQAIVFNVFGQVIKRTPVDTGRAKANWNVTEGMAGLSTDDRRDKSHLGNIGINSIRELNKITEKFGLDILTNNLPYIERLEFGSSNQAPAGMVRVTLREFTGIAKKQGWG